MTFDEDCDDGDNTDGDGCNSNCEVENAYYCTGNPSVCTTQCGDGLRAGSELCDDGNTDGSTDCNSDCTGPAPGYSCDGGDSTQPDTCTEVCGDGILTASEE